MRPINVNPPKHGATIRALEPDGSGLVTFFVSATNFRTVEVEPGTLAGLVERDPHIVTLRPDGTIASIVPAPQGDRMILDGKGCVFGDCQGGAR